MTKLWAISLYLNRSGHPGFASEELACCCHEAAIAALRLVPEMSSELY